MKHIVRMRTLVVSLTLLGCCCGCGTLGQTTTPACFLEDYGTIQQFHGPTLTIQNQHEQLIQATFSSTILVLSEEPTTRLQLQYASQETVAIVLSPSKLSSPVLQMIGIPKALRTASNAALTQIHQRASSSCSRTSNTSLLWPGASIVGMLVKTDAQTVTVADQSGITTTLNLTPSTAFFTVTRGTIATVKLHAQILFFGLRDPHGRTTLSFIQVFT